MANLGEEGQCRIWSSRKKPQLLQWRIACLKKANKHKNLQALDGFQSQREMEYLFMKYQANVQSKLGPN
jgi:hypothetical protein